MAQVGYLSDIQEASKAPVDILVINAAGHEAWNAEATEDHDLPWLQDLEDVDVWGLWDIRYRDVVVVGPDGYPAGTYNLTSSGLSDPDNAAALAELIEDAG